MRLIALRGLLCPALILAGCVAGEDLAQTVSPVAIAGRWIAPTSTQAIAATQHVDVVDPPTVSPQGRCTSTNAFACSCTHPACMAALPGTRELDAYLRRRWTFLRPGGTYCCRQNSATTSVPRMSVHSLGRAIDLMVPMDRGDADNTLGDAVANWLVENAEHIGVQRVVWDRSYWNGERGFGPLATNSLPHTDHLHVELSVDGAARRTPFFTSGASTGTSCEARCDGTRVIAANCAVTECATLGATCVGGPPRCGTPAPPEPADAARVANATPPSVRALAEPLRVTPLTPSRRFDTRTPSESTLLLRGGATGPLAENTPATLRDWSSASLPASTRAVWMNFTAVSDTVAGFVTAWAEGDPRPETSSLNYAIGDVRANASVVALGASQGMSVMASSGVHLIGDLYAAFAPTGSGLALVPPTRVYDTRSASNPLRSNEVRTIALSAPAGATGVFGTVTAVARDIPGFLQVFPCGAAPTTSAANFAARTVASNAFSVGLRDGALCVLSNADPDVIVDVTGYLTPTGALLYRPIAPVRILDTRGAATPYTGRLGARQVVELAVQTLPGVPANVGAVVANVTALGATEGGYLSAFPCGGALPTTSSLNFAVGTARSTLALSGVGRGALCVFASTRAHLIVDLLGVWVSVSGTTPSMPPETDPEDGGDDMHPEADAGVAAMDVPAVPDVAVGRDATAVTEVSLPRDSGARADVPSGPGENNPGTTPGDLGATEALPAPGCGCRATNSPRRSSTAAAFALLGLVMTVRRRRYGCTARVSVRA